MRKRGEFASTLEVHSTYGAFEEDRGITGCES